MPSFVKFLPILFIVLLGACSFVILATSPRADSYASRQARGNFLPFQTGYVSRTARMAKKQGVPRVMYNGGYTDTRSRFQPTGR